MLQLFNEVAAYTSKCTTRKYSTSFSLGIHLLHSRFHEPIYAIYGFVRFADEIVDTFHGYDKEKLLDQFEKDTYDAIEHGISMNPILHSFQRAVHQYGIDRELIDTFLGSMRMDLHMDEYNRTEFEKYILGSAEVVGLMCLRVFTEGDRALYEELKPAAMRLGAAFQKVNFLRDIRADYQELGRTYFPGLDLTQFTIKEKLRIESEIAEDFAFAMEGIRKLPRGAKRGVYIAHVYYRKAV